MHIPADGTCFPYTSRRRINRLFFCITFCLNDSFDDLIFKLGSDTDQQKQSSASSLFTVQQRQKRMQTKADLFFNQQHIIHLPLTTNRDSR